MLLSVKFIYHETTKKFYFAFSFSRVFAIELFCKRIESTINKLLIDGCSVKNLAEIIHARTLLFLKLCRNRHSRRWTDLCMDDIFLVYRLIKSHSDSLNQNIETVSLLYPTVHSEANYDHSLEVLKQVQQYNSFGRVTDGPAATWYADFSTLS